MRNQQDNAILAPGTVRIIVIGGSAGSLPALRMITGEFPTDFGAAIFVVEHVSPHLPFNLPQFLSREGALPVQYAIDQEPIAPGRIYVAPRMSTCFWTVVECACSAVLRTPGIGRQSTFCSARLQRRTEVPWQAWF